MDARQKILTSATKLFSTQGYAKTSLAQVAKDAEVSKALIFWHFESKDDLFRTALKTSLEPFSIDVVGLLEGLDEMAQIHKLVDLYYEFVSQNVYSVRFLLSLVVREEKNLDDLLDRTVELYRIYCSMLADIIQTGCERRTFRADAAAETEAALIMATLNGVLVQGFLGGNVRFDAEPLLEQLKRSLEERLLASRRFAVPGVVSRVRNRAHVPAALAGAGGVAPPPRISARYASSSRLAGTADASQEYAHDF